MHPGGIMRNFVRDRIRHGIVGLVLTGVAAVAAGCGEAPMQDSAPTEEVGQSATEAPMLFRDPSTSGPRLDVYDFGGHAAISVSGPIGTEAQFSGITAESVEDLYRAVHPDTTTIPAELIALGERLAPALAELRAMPRPAEASPAVIQKSYSDFSTNVCRTFWAGSYRYEPVECQWDTGMDQLLIFRNPPHINAGDRTYGYNANPVQAKMHWGRNAVMAFQITLPAYWWNWMSVYSGGPYYAELRLSGGWTGELGLTHHRRRAL
jgi:hypothetical protein